MRARAAGAPRYHAEADLAACWAAAPRGPLRLEDGRALKVVFPGVPGGGSGPDFTGAILDAGGDLLRGDVEVHLRASGWRAHGHHADEAYAGVVLHVVGENDVGAASTLHAGARAIAVLVLRPEERPAFPPPFTPPCALRAAQGFDAAPVLERISLRRLRVKAARASPLVRDGGAGQALYALALEVLGGAANREPFAALARRLPLAALLERAGEAMAPRALALGAELRGAAAPLALRRAGLRPMAEPGRRLTAAGALFGAWWPDAFPGWPETLSPGANLLAPRPPGLGRSAAIELAVNAVLPVALAASAWPEAAVEEAWRTLSSPGTYGRLRPLERWLSAEGRPFATAARLQGGLLLHNDYCTKGACGRCPVSG